MCGRFMLRAPADQLAMLFGLSSEPVLVPRYNIAPTQPVGLVRMDKATQEREWALAIWGLIPSWAKDPSIGARMINARSETAAEKPSFRAAYKRRRCLIPTDGFYEWQKLGSRKQPFYISMADGDPFAFAGLWEHWIGPDGSELRDLHHPHDHAQRTGRTDPQSHARDRRSPGLRGLAGQRRR